MLKAQALVSGGSLCRAVPPAPGGAVRRPALSLPADTGRNSKSYGGNCKDVFLGSGSPSPSRGRGATREACRGPQTGTRGCLGRKKRPQPFLSLTNRHNFDKSQTNLAYLRAVCSSGSVGGKHSPSTPRVEGGARRSGTESRGHSAGGEGGKQVARVGHSPAVGVAGLQPQDPERSTICN